MDCPSSFDSEILIQNFCSKFKQNKPYKFEEFLSPTGLERSLELSEFTESPFIQIFKAIAMQVLSSKL